MNDYATNDSGRRRLLILIDAGDSANGCLRYAARLAAAGDRIEACLLYVAEPLRSWEVLRFRTEEEIATFVRNSAEVFLAAASAQLASASVPCRTVFREAETVPAILDAAEELGCSEIVIPRPDWLDWRSCRLASRLLRSPGAVPVTLVAAGGEPVR